MRFPVAWLREFVEISEAPAGIAERLTMAGLVVDAVEGTGDDAVLDVDLPANRPDAMNVYGLARELAASAAAPLRPYPTGAAESPAARPASESASVAIEAQDLCRRYCGRVVRNVRVGPSPEWLTRRLAAAGLNAVNNIVDVTNYVLWEYGHPLHAFDLGTIGGRRIVVRRARGGETLRTLDGVDRRLDPEILAIADADRAVALAGIMGGAATMISDRTTEILLESAWFDPGSVRRTSKRLGLSTDASYRFERGASVEAASAAVDRAAALLAQVAGGEVAPGLLDARVAPGPARALHLRLSRIAGLLGVTVGADEAAGALRRLGFEVVLSGDGFDVTVPPHRVDIHGEPDLVEEVGRIVGYHNIPDRVPHLPGIGAINRFAHRREAALRDALRGAGCSEAMTFSFVGRDVDALLGEPGARALPLANPMAEGQEILRTTLLPGLAAAARHNLNHGVRDVRLYEIGRAFRRAAGRAEAGAPVPHVEESLLAGVAIAGLARPRHWAEPAREASLYDLKGILEEAFARLGLSASFGALDGAHPFRPDAAAAILLDGRRAGRLGALAPGAAARLGLKAEVLLAEADLGLLFAAPESHATYRPLPRHPSSARDLALVVREGIPWAAIETAIRETGGTTVASVRPFDRYRGRGLPAGHASLGVGIVWQHPDRTLGSDEIAAAESRILSVLNDRFGITLRR